MSEVLVRVSSALYNDSEVTINGRREKFTANGRGSYELSFQTDETTEIKITRRHELASPMWLLWSLFFFVISLFGIFDVPYSKKSAICCTVNVSPNGGGLVQITPNIKRDGGAVFVQSDNCGVELTDNSPDDKTIKKRLKTLRIIKALAWVALIVVVVLVVVL